MKSVDAVMDERQEQYATAAASAADNARMEMHRAGTRAGKAGLPLRFRSEAARIELEVQRFEEELGAYVSEMAR